MSIISTTLSLFPSSAFPDFTLFFLLRPFGDIRRRRLFSLASDQEKKIIFGDCRARSRRCCRRHHRLHYPFPHHPGARPLLPLPNASHDSNIIIPESGVRQLGNSNDHVLIYEILRNILLTNLLHSSFLLIIFQLVFVV